MPEGIGYDTPALRLKKRMKKTKPSLDRIKGRPVENPPTRIKPRSIERITSVRG